MDEEGKEEEGEEENEEKKEEEEIVVVLVVKLGGSGGEVIEVRKRAFLAFTNCEGFSKATIVTRILIVGKFWVLEEQKQSRH